jgi:hypothetical protein
MCDGKRQGTFSQKYNICMECDFYKTVKEEEGTNMEMSIILLNMIRINKAKVKE